MNPPRASPPNQIVEIRELIKAIGREKTVMLSSRILKEVEMTCDRILIINRGQRVAEGTTENLRRRFRGRIRLRVEVKAPDAANVTAAFRSLEDWRDPTVWQIARSTIRHVAFDYPADSSFTIRQVGAPGCFVSARIRTMRPGTWPKPTAIRTSSRCERPHGKGRCYRGAIHFDDCMHCIIKRQIQLHHRAPSSSISDLSQRKKQFHWRQHARLRP